MTTRTLRALALVAGLVAASAAHGQSPRPEPEADTSPQLVKRFDFNERPLGNYEDLPMQWVRLRGDGLPAYSAAAFDDAVGHVDPPALRFNIQGGSAACEYTGVLPVQAGCDYRIEAYVRTQSLEYARAFVECALLDPLGDLIPGTVRISELSGGTADWRRVTIPIAADSALAKRVRLRLWVLQRHAWEHGNAALDPVVRQDVSATVWFDDIALERVPRLRVGTTAPGNLIAADATPELHLSIHNSTIDAVDAGLEVTSERGTSVHTARFEIAASASETIDHPLPKLERGWYRADVRLSGGGTTILERSTTFVVLPPLPRPAGLADDVGVAIPRWQPGADDGLRALVESLGGGALKLGLAADGDGAAGQGVDQSNQLRRLIQSLAEKDVDTVGAILIDASGEADDWRAATEDLIMRCATFLTAWQVGDECRTHQGAALDAQIACIHEQLERRIASARLATPRDLLDEPAAAALAAAPGVSTEPPPHLRLRVADAYYLAPSVPTASIPWQLAGWLDPPDTTAPQPARWLTTDWGRSGSSLAERRIELARRVLLARMFDPARLFVVAPFEHSTDSGSTEWRPTDEYLPIRTLLNFVADTEPVAALDLPNDATGLVFRSGSQELLAIWTWTDALDRTLPLSVGPAARAWTIDGDPVELRVDGCRTEIPLHAEPLLLTDVDCGLLRVERSVTIEPAIVQPHSKEPRPTIAFTNHYTAPLVGVLHITPPAGWKVEPLAVPFELAAGEPLRVPLDITIRPREMSEDLPLGLEVRLRRPREQTLTFHETMRVDLLDARLKTTCSWNGDDLIIEQRLTNLAETPLRFSAFVQAPDRPRLEGAFLQIAPGDTGIQHYRLSNARSMAGSRVWTGIREIEGPRFLDQLVDVPR